MHVPRDGSAVVGCIVGFIVGESLASVVGLGLGLAVVDPELGCAVGNAEGAAEGPAVGAAHTEVFPMLVIECDQRVRCHGCDCIFNSEKVFFLGPT